MTLERITFDVPPETHQRLRAVAKRLKRTESEVARDLLVHALERAERDELCRDIERSLTDDMRRRMVEVTEALERVDG